MGMMLNLETESQIIRAVISGEFSDEEGKRTFLEILGTSERLGIDKILIDGAQVTGNINIIQRFFYGEFVAQTTLDLRMRSNHYPQLAYVLKEPVLDPNRFGETVAVNRGAFCKAFDNIHEALAWLKAPLTKGAEA